MLSIRQGENSVTIKLNGEFPDLICDLAVLYKIIALRGAAMNIDVPRLVERMTGNRHIERIAQDYREITGG